MDSSRMIPSWVDSCSVYVFESEVVKMHHVYIMAITSALLLASPVWAQQDSAEQALPCVAVPVFHCVQHLEGGAATAHFGYDLQCPDGAGTAAELYVDAGDDNLFSPGPVARGQTTLFLSGEHLDEFAADYSAAEVKSGSGIHWSVLGKTATVDFSKTKDGSLDCNNLPY